MARITLTKIAGELPLDRHDDFFDEVVKGATDLQLADKFALRERTATNYRKRAETIAAERGIAIAKKTKAGASDSDLLDNPGAALRTGDYTVQPPTTETHGGSNK